MKLHFLEASSQREELFQAFTFIIKCKTSKQNTVIMHQLICTVWHGTDMHLVQRHLMGTNNVLGMYLIKLRA